MSDQKLQIGLELNRAFFDGRGDDLVNIIAECVERGVIAIGEASAKRLLDTVRTAASPPREE